MAPKVKRKGKPQSLPAATVGLKVVRTEDGLRLHLDHPDQSAGIAQLTAALGLSDPALCNRIILDLNVKKDSVGSVIVTTGGVGVPSIDTREISTQVLVNDGETVVLGGILETEDRSTIKKVPYLGDIPVLGNLFKQTSRTNNKDELLIFVTPKILHEGVNVY